MEILCINFTQGKISQMKIKKIYNSLLNYYITLCKNRDSSEFPITTCTAVHKSVSKRDISRCF